MAEQFRFDKLGSQCRTVDCKEGTSRTSGMIVEVPCQEVLAAAALSEEQHGAVAFRREEDLFQGGLHDFGSVPRSVKFIQRVQFLTFGYVPQDSAEAHDPSRRIFQRHSRGTEDHCSAVHFHGVFRLYGLSFKHTGFHVA